MRPEMGDRDAIGRTTPRRRVTARQRRKLVGWLRLTARRRRRPQTGRYRCDLLLEDRVAGVRVDLLEIAAWLEWADDPDPACVAELRWLLRDGCESPLYNRDVHISELRATVYYAKQALVEPRGHRHDTGNRNPSASLQPHS
jgi:hypothetical protein